MKSFICAFGHVYTFVNTDLLFWRNIFYIAKALDNVRFVGFYTCSRIWFCISLSGNFLLYNSSSILQSQFCSCTVLLRSGVVARFD